MEEETIHLVDKEKDPEEPCKITISQKLLTSEEIQMQEIEKHKQLMKQMLKHNAKNVTKMSEKHVMQPVRSLQLTIPQSPMLETTKRAKTHRCSIRHGDRASSHLNFQKDDNPCPRSASLSKLKNRQRDALEMKRSSRQQQQRLNQSAYNVDNDDNNNGNQNTKTAHGLGLFKTQSSSSSSPCHKSKVTIPQSFKLSKARCKMETKTSEELSQEESQKHTFKARKLNRKLFETHGVMGIPKVNTKPPTVPINFALRTEKRAKSYKLQTDSNNSEHDISDKSKKQFNKNIGTKGININDNN